MKILFVISGPFPDGNAYALRARSFACLLHELNHEVIVLCDTIEAVDAPDTDSGLIQGIKLYSFGEGRHKFKKVLLPDIYFYKIRSIIQQEKPDIILSSSMYDRFNVVLKQARKTGIPIILESCEWFHPSTFRFGRFDRHYITFHWYWTHLFCMANGFVTISRKLAEHYQEYTRNVIRIPTILDVNNIQYNIDSELKSQINLLFAGTFARTKDSIRSFVEAIDLLGDKSNRFSITVCGVSQNALEMHLGVCLYHKYIDQIICMGVIPQQEINALYRRHDFGIFIRPHIHSSDAGFSTKLGEGMAAGTPFIVNSTGDIPLFIHDGDNGFLIRDETVTGVAMVLQRVLSMSTDERITMRKKARETAEKHFNYITYKEQLEDFLKQVLKDKGDYDYV